MMHNDNDKRLVLIGIRRKGDKGFKKRFDEVVKANQASISSETIHIPTPKLSNSFQIMNLLSK